METNNELKRNRCLLYSLVEGGTMQPIKVDLYEDELKNFTSVEKRLVFSKVIGKKINTLAVEIGDKHAHSLFFEDGKSFDCEVYGFKERVGYDDGMTRELFNRIYREKIESK